MVESKENLLVMAKPTPIPTIPPFSNEINQERQIIQQPVQTPQLPPDLSFFLGGSSIGASAIFTVWFIYDRLFRSRGDRMMARIMHPYTNLGLIRNNIQVIRSETNAQRAILLELNSRDGLMLDIAQETDSGISKIYFSPQDNQVSCIKKILERFHDEKFIQREVETIDIDSYKGFLRSHGVSFVIYYKVGVHNDLNWMLALHYRYTNHADFINACEMKSQIGARCDELFYQLMQRSPVKSR